MEILLGILFAICLLMLATILGRLVAMRRRLVPRTDVFRCKVRVTSGAIPELSRRPCHHAAPRTRGWPPGRRLAFTTC